MSSGNIQLSFGLKKSTLNKLCSVFQSHGNIDSVILYGSRAKGSYKLGSDIDLTIKGGLLPFFEFLQIEDWPWSCYHAMLGKVDQCIVYSYYK